MLKYNLKSAVRNLVQQRFFTLINIAGLSLGIATFLILIHYVEYEFSYDEYLPGSGNIYRLNYVETQGNEAVIKSAKTHSGIIPFLELSIPEIESSTKMLFEDCLIFNDRAKIFQKGFWVDKSFFKVFPIKMLTGNADKALTDPFTMVISRSQAIAYFGDKDPIGQKVYLNEWIPFTISGVFEDIPENASIRFNFLTSWSTITESFHEEKASGTFDNQKVYTFVKLHPGVKNIENINTGLEKIALDNIPNLLNRGAKGKYELEPLNQIHFSSGLKGELEPGRSKALLYALTFIAIFVLISALINFINLSLAQSFHRAKEITLRKIYGATVLNICKQFSVEAFIMSTTACAVGLVMYIFLGNMLSNYLPPERSSIVRILNSRSIVYLFFLLLIVLLTALYPIRVVTNYKPTFILRKEYNNSNSRNLLKNILIVFQFFLAILTIGCTVTIYRQINYMRNYNLGMNMAQTISLHGPASRNADPRRYSRLVAFKQDVLNDARFSSATATVNMPGQELAFHDESIRLLAGANVKNRTFGVLSIDDGYLETFSLKLLAGRNIEEKDKGRYCLVNQSAAKALGFSTPESAINAEFISKEKNHAVIAGVIQDFHQESLRRSIEPIIFYFDHPVLFGYYSFRTSSKNRSGFLDMLRNKWKTHYPDDPFIYYFTDSFFASQYKNDELFGKLMILFSIISILVASMGLIGLTALCVQTRTREIGIRKVLGASALRILFILSKDYTRLVILGYLCALPLLYYFINKWIESFSYRVGLSLLIWLVPGVAVLLLAWIVATTQSLKAALANPVESLQVK